MVLTNTCLKIRYAQSSHSSIRPVDWFLTTFTPYFRLNSCNAVGEGSLWKTTFHCWRTCWVVFFLVNTLLRREINHAKTFSPPSFFTDPRKIGKFGSGAPETRKVWERFSHNMRKKLNLGNFPSDKDGERIYTWKQK